MKDSNKNKYYLQVRSINNKGGMYFVCWDRNVILDLSNVLFLYQYT